MRTYVHSDVSFILLKLLLNLLLLNLDDYLSKMIDLDHFYFTTWKKTFQPAQ
jgi:hypothetical protein